MLRSREDCPEICPFCSLSFFLPFSEIVVARLCSVNIAGVRHLVWKAQHPLAAQLAAPAVSIGVRRDTANWHATMASQRDVPAERVKLWDCRSNSSMDVISFRLGST